MKNKVIRVPEKIAGCDACYMEHEHHPVTIRQNTPGQEWQPA